jgi:hypothetical protein
MFTELLKKEVEEKMRLGRHQLPRLHNLRLANEKKKPGTRNLLTEMRSDVFAAHRRREADRRGNIHWFLKGTPIYVGDNEMVSEMLAHLHNYIESGGARYLEQAELNWQDTLETRHDGAIQDRYWLDVEVPRLRLITQRDVA